MDWNKQAEDMMKTWTETQKKMWDNWLDVAQPGSVQPQFAELWQQTMETWEGTVKSTLAAQNEWTQSWVSSVEQAGLPKELAELLKQGQEMSNQWAEAQQKLWQSWFSLMKDIEPTTFAPKWEDEGKKAFETWQEAAQKVMDAQKEWQSTWAEQVKTA